MNILHLREPVSAASHGLWLLLALPGVRLLWRRGAGDRAKQLSLMTYALSLAFCAAASTLYHSVPLPDEGRAPFLLLDHAGIAALIAGTYTPIAWNMLRGRWRWLTLALAWLVAASGALLRLGLGGLPPWLSTGQYLVMGWGVVFYYFEFARALSHRILRPIVVGGLFYSVGAVFNLMCWPVLWPGVFEAHELFHLFVMAGSLAHFAFILRVVAPWTREPESSSLAPGRGIPPPDRGFPPTARCDVPQANGPPGLAASASG